MSFSEFLNYGFAKAYPSLHRGGVFDWQLQLCDPGIPEIHEG